MPVDLQQLLTREGDASTLDTGMINLVSTCGRPFGKTRFVLALPWDEHETILLKISEVKAELEGLIEFTDLQVLVICENMSDLCVRLFQTITMLRCRSSSHPILQCQRTSPGIHYLTLCFSLEL